MPSVGPAGVFLVKIGSVTGSFPGITGAGPEARIAPCLSTNTCSFIVRYSFLRFEFCCGDVEPLGVRAAVPDIEPITMPVLATVALNNNDEAVLSNVPRVLKIGSRDQVQDTFVPIEIPEL